MCKKKEERNSMCVYVGETPFSKFQKLCFYVFKLLSINKIVSQYEKIYHIVGFWFDEHCDGCQLQQ